jgi:hypothetical protein
VIPGSNKTIGCPVLRSSINLLHPIQPNLPSITEAEQLPPILDVGDGLPDEAGQHGLKAWLQAPEGWSVYFMHDGQAVQQVVQGRVFPTVQCGLAHYGQGVVDASHSQHRVLLVELVHLAHNEVHHGEVKTDLYLIQLL